MLTKVRADERTSGNNPRIARFGVQQSDLDELSADALSLTRWRNFGVNEREIVSSEFIFEEGESFFELQLKAVLRLVVGNAGRSHG